MFRRFLCGAWISPESPESRVRRRSPEMLEIADPEDAAKSYAEHLPTKFETSIGLLVRNLSSCYTGCADKEQGLLRLGLQSAFGKI